MHCTVVALPLLIMTPDLQGSYEARSIFQSLDLAWTLLRLFPRELLRRITSKTLDAYYSAEQHQN
jgi:V-type H+-transporting ATPase subunit B